MIAFSPPCDAEFIRDEPEIRFAAYGMDHFTVGFVARIGAGIIRRLKIARTGYPNFEPFTEELVYAVFEDQVLPGIRILPRYPAVKFITV